jgi:hypothetical protein
MEPSSRYRWQSVTWQTIWYNKGLNPMWNIKASPPSKRQGTHQRTMPIGFPITNWKLHSCSSEKVLRRLKTLYRYLRRFFCVLQVQCDWKVSVHLWEQIIFSRYLWLQHGTTRWSKVVVKVTSHVRHFGRAYAQGLLNHLALSTEVRRTCIVLLLISR